MYIIYLKLAVVYGFILAMRLAYHKITKQNVL